MKKNLLVFAVFSGAFIAQAHTSAQPDPHAGHDHAKEAVPHDHHGDGVSDHGSHDDHSNHEGHDHGEGGGIELRADMIKKIGIQIHEATGGTVARSSVFPAEIKLNRDTTVSVSARFPSIVRQVFSEIGDTVREGDVLASLENRETMAVYAVMAPRGGVIIAKNLAPGESASEDAVLFEIADLSTVWADINIFPQYQHLIRKGSAVTFVARDGHTTRGTVKYISPVISPETRTLTARCVLEGVDGDFMPGAFVRARIIIQSVDADVVAPRDAIQTLEGEQVVFVPSDHGFIAAPVKIGLMDEYKAEILSGLKVGDEFVAVGAFALKAQMITSGMDPHAGHSH